MVALMKTNDSHIVKLSCVAYNVGWALGVLNGLFPGTGSEPGSCSTKGEDNVGSVWRKGI